MLSLIWAIPLVVAIFLWVLNTFLRGSLKQVITGLLTSVIVALWVVAFFVSGWVVALDAVLASCVLAISFWYPALLIVRKLTEYPDLGMDDYSRGRFERYMKYHSNPVRYGERLEEEKRKESEHMAKTTDKAVGRADVQEVLQRLSCAKEDVEAFYQSFPISSLPPHFREIAVCNANMLAYFLENRDSDDLDVQLTIGRWARHNPSGSQP
jgi:hypothetical protein